MTLNKTSRTFLLALAAVLAVAGCEAVTLSRQPAQLSQVTTGGELQRRIQRNFGRLQEEKYQPANVFLTEQQSGGWPGDTEGRTILGLVMDAQAGKLQPQYLDSIISLIPQYLNKRGYMGPVYEGAMNEQQLSGNGWMLRGLCEYYLWKRDPRVLGMIRSIAGLFMSGQGRYSRYPIDPKARNTQGGGASGSIEGQTDGWMLSTDVGCVYIGMEGFIQAYGILQDAAMQPVIEEMIARFLKQDLVKMRAQTHASLTAMRGLIRYAELTGKTRYIDEARKRFNLYLANGMAEDYENYNWFDRFDAWSEPCAIVDSYMVAMQLWQHTGKARYRDVAERIYYNGLCATQRANGGFGCDGNPGRATSTPFVTIHADEAHWCCTMRGGEGLSRVAQYAYYTSGDTLWVAHYGTSRVAAQLASGEMQLTQSTDYPFASQVSFAVGECPGKAVTLKIAVPSWVNNLAVTVNGEAVAVKPADGFATIVRQWASGDRIQLDFGMDSGAQGLVNSANAGKWKRRVAYGPLLLGHRGAAEAQLPSKVALRQTGRREWQVEGTGLLLTSLWHDMDPAVSQAAKYSFQLLFE